MTDGPPTRSKAGAVAADGESPSTSPAARATAPAALTRSSLAVLMLLFFVVGFAFSWAGSAKVPAALLDIHQKPWNVWFQADLTRVYANMTERHSDHYRSKVHPLFSLATIPLVSSLQWAGVAPVLAVRGTVALVSGLWLAVFGLVLRRMGIPWPDTLVFSLLAQASAAALFWTTVPETYVFGSLSMLAVLLLVTDTRSSDRSIGWWVAASAASLSMTTTNWMTGVVATASSHPWRKCLRITAGALLVVTLLWGVQKALIPTAQFFLGDRGETRYLLMVKAGGPAEKLAAFFIHTMVMPTVEVRDRPQAATWPRLSVQFAKVGSSSPLGVVATALWVALLALGGVTAWRLKSLKRLRLVVALTIAGQLGLHLVYGDETFLYSLHWLPFLVILAAMSAFSRFRGAVLVAAALLTVLAGANNLRQFSLATAVIKVPSRDVVHQAPASTELDPAGQAHDLTSVANQADTPSPWDRGRSPIDTPATDPHHTPAAHRQQLGSLAP